jgi:hypothetical protein
MSSDVDFLKGLEHLNESEFPTYYSPEAKERATELAARASKKPIIISIKLHQIVTSY